MSKKEIGNVTIEDAQIIFRNFAGKPDLFNKAGGVRQFSVPLDPQIAEAMQADGWNISFRKIREDDEDQEPRPYLKVTARFDNYPPRIFMITSRGRTFLGEDDVELLDGAYIEKADLIISPYQYEVNGKTGIKAYLKTMYVTIEEDDLDRKYSTYADSSREAQDYDV